MNLKYLFLSASVLSIALSGAALAKKPEGKGNPHHRGVDAYSENSNRQSEEFSLRGKDRAKERHDLKKCKKHKKNKDKYHGDDWHKSKHGRDEYRRKGESYRYHNDRLERHEKKYDRYERQRHLERYQNNPIDTEIDRNVRNVKSKINKVHDKAIDAIDNKTRELTGSDVKREQTRKGRPWWSIFGGE